MAVVGKAVGDKVSDKDLIKLYRDRVKDRTKFKTKRRRSVESTPPPMKQLVHDLFHSTPQALKRIDENRAMMAWPTYVGAAVAAQARAVKMRGNTLVVQVDDPLWMQQLMFLKGDIVRKYRKDFPKLGLTDIYFTR